MLSNFLTSAIWANRIAGFQYYSNISNDMETIGVSSLITGIDVILVITISICVISKCKIEE